MNNDIYRDNYSIAHFRTSCIGQEANSPHTSHNRFARGVGYDAGYWDGST